MSAAGSGADAPVRTIFASAGDEPRRRRPADLLAFGAGAIVVLVAALVARSSPAREAEVAAAFDALFGWLEPLWTIAYGAASVAVVALIAAAGMSRRRVLVRDLVVAAIATLVCGFAVGRIVEGAWPSLRDALWRTDDDPAYPALRVALITAAALVAAPDLTRPLRRTGSALVALTCVAAMVTVDAGPSDVLGGLALGLVIGAGVRLAFGSSAGFPQESRVRAALHDLRLDGVSNLHRAASQPEGAARYFGRVGDDALAVTVYGRDARDTQFLAKLWRLLWYRDAGPQASYTRLQQVEHEALLLHVAAGVGVPVPAVVAVGPAVTGDALVVTTEPEQRTLAELDAADVSDELLGEVWSVAIALRGAHIGHGRLNTASFVVSDGNFVLTRLGGGRMAAPDAVLATDVAELLVSCALLVGEERALQTAEATVGSSTLIDALPYLQQAALTPTLRDEVRRSALDVDALRRRIAERTGAELPEVAEVRRVTIGRVAIVALTALAAYALISQIADIGLDTIIDTFAEAEWVWAVLALLLAQVPLVTDALATQAAVGAALPLGPLTLLQSAVKFINLCLPSAAGKVALTVRFLHRQGVDRAIALTQGALDSFAGFVIQALILLVVLPGLNLDLQPSEDGPSNLIKIGAILVVGAAVGVVVFICVPVLRRRLRPYVAPVLSNLKGLLSSPRRAVKLLLANTGSQVLYALALCASVRAFGSDVSLAEALFVNTGSSLLTGLVPVPGGIGVAEAAITTGLVVVGVPEPTALAAALMHRMATYYLPPIWGFVSMRWLSTHGYV